MNQMITIPFHGSELQAVAQKGAGYLIVKRACEDLGLDANGQVQRLKRQPWASACMMHVQIPGDDQRREVFCLHQDSVPMWLATIQTSRVRKDRRALLVTYQKECARVLRDHFLGQKGGGLTAAELDRILEAQRQVLEERLSAALRELARLRAQLAAVPGALRPMDICAAWARAYVEPAEEPVSLKDVLFPAFARWVFSAGHRLTSHTALGGGLELAGIERARGAYSPVHYLCRLRAEPLAVELPRPAQQELPLEQPDLQQRAEELAERALAVLGRHPTGLETQHLAQVLGCPVEEMTAALGAMVEAGALQVQPRGARLYYQPAKEAPPDRRSELRDRIRAYMDARPGEALTTKQIVEELGLEPSASNMTQVGIALRDLGYERRRTSLARGWRAVVYTKPAKN